MIYNDIECPKCKSHNLMWDEDDYGWNDFWRCLDCNWRFKDKKDSQIPKKDDPNVVLSIN